MCVYCKQRKGQKPAGEETGCYCATGYHQAATSGAEKWGKFYLLINFNLILPI